MLNLIMQSRYHAALFLLVFSLGVFILPLVYVLGLATLALVTLHRGWAEALMVAGIAAALLVVIGMLLQISPQRLALIMAISWLPIIVMATQIKVHGHVVYGLRLGFILALLVLAYLYMITTPNADTFWHKFYEANLQPIITELNLGDAQALVLKTILVNNMNNILTSGVVLSVVTGLLLGRYWQARLYNPGGFGTEFRQLRFGRILAAIAVAVLLISMLDSGFEFFTDLERSFIILFVLQGLAIVHFLVFEKNVNHVVLFALYGMLLVLPAIGFLLSVIGILDNWLDIRARL